MKTIDYNYITCPINLIKMMDSSCRNLLVALLIIEFEERNNTFNVSSNILQTLTGYSRKVVNATLSALHRSGIITVKCAGNGKGKKQPTNTITINYDKFKEYDEQFITITKLLDESQHIVIDNYHQKGYRVSYLEEDEHAIIPKEYIEIAPPAAPAPEENNIEIISTADEGVMAAYPFSEEEDSSVEEEGASPLGDDKTKNNNPTENRRIDMKDFKPETIIEFAKENNLSIYSSGIPSPTYFKMQNQRAFSIIENKYGMFEEKQVEELWRFCKNNGVSF